MHIYHSDHEALNLFQSITDLKVAFCHAALKESQNSRAIILNV